MSRRDKIVNLIESNEISNEETTTLVNELNTIIIELSKLK